MAIVNKSMQELDMEKRIIQNCIFLFENTLRCHDADDPETMGDVLKELKRYMYDPTMFARFFEQVRAEKIAGRALQL